MEPHNKIPEEDLIAELQRMAEDGVAPTGREMGGHGKYAVSPYQRAFGSWLEAIEAAGLEPQSPNGGIPREDLLDELHRLAEDGVAPKYDDMVIHGAYSPMPYKREFGSWSAALEESELEVVRETRKVPDEELIDELQRLAEDGVAPTISQMIERGAHSYKPYARAFGSWAEAAKVAGLKPAHTQMQASDEDLIDELRRVAEGEYAPTQREMDQKGAFSHSTYTRAFGSWKEACEAAGLVIDQPCGPTGKVSEEELIEELHRLAEDGHAPTQKKMREEGEYSYTPYKRAFGSWEGAVEAADLHQPLPKSLSSVMREALKAQSRGETVVGGAD